jgi:hypothetical protein
MPYVQVHIDAEDCIADISSEQLAKELRKRGHDIDDRILERIKDELSFAWRYRDEQAFDRAMRMLTDSEKEEKRDQERMRMYAELMKEIRSQDNPPPTPIELRCEPDADRPAKGSKLQCRMRQV